MKKVEVRNRLLDGTACGACTSERERALLWDLEHAPTNRMNDEGFDRHVDEIARFASRLARRHTCGDFYPVRLASARSYLHLEVLVDDGGRVCYRAVFGAADNRLFGPIEADVDAALLGYTEMTRRIGETR